MISRPHSPCNDMMSRPCPGANGDSFNTYQARPPPACAARVSAAPGAAANWAGEQGQHDSHISRQHSPGQGSAGSARQALAREGQLKRPERWVRAPLPAGGSACETLLAPACMWPLWSSRLRAPDARRRSPWSAAGRQAQQPLRHCSCLPRSDAASCMCWSASRLAAWWTRAGAQDGCRACSLQTRARWGQAAYLAIRAVGSGQLPSLHALACQPPLPACRSLSCPQSQWPLPRRLLWCPLGSPEC
jgi:hypothetical protein